MSIGELIMVAAEKVAKELEARYKQNENEKVSLDGAAEGVRFYVQVLTEELNRAVESKSENSVAEGQNTESQQRVESEDSNN